MYENIFRNQNLLINIAKDLGAGGAGLLLVALTLSDDKYSTDIKDKGIALEEFIRTSKQEYEGEFQEGLEKLVEKGYMLKIGDKYHPSIKILCLM